MTQFEMLLNYQQEDIKADRIAAELRRSPVRQKMDKLRAQSQEYKKQYQQIDAKVTDMADRMDVIRDALPHYEEQLAALNDRVQKEPPETLEAARKLVSEANRLREAINGFESELKRISRESNDHAKAQVKLRHDAAAVKQEFEVLKAEYDKEQQTRKDELESQRAAAAAACQGIEKRYLDQYISIKKHIPNPVARLVNNQCSGCNTTLPSALLRQLKESPDPVECETCGRMIITL